MTISGINITVWLWMAVYAYLLYAIVFFLYSHVTMTARQVKFFIPAIFVWTLIETYFTCLPASQFQMIMCNFFELSWLLPTVYLFTECFSLSLIRFSVVSWIANALSVVVMNIYDHDDYLLFSVKRLNEISWKSIAVFTVSVVIVIFLEYPLISRILPYKPHLVPVYRIGAGLYLVIVMVDYIIEINAAAGGEFVWRGTIKSLSAICLSMFVVLLAVMAKRRRMNTHKKQLETRIELLNSEYENIVEKNRELHKVRHELNKQAEILRVTKGYVPEMVRMDMIGQIETSVARSFSGMSLSGNLMIDTLLEKSYKELKDKGIVLETVLTPIRFPKALEDDIVVVQEELFKFGKRFYESSDSIRYSIRVKNDKLFILFEAGLSNVGAYKRQRLIDLIGDKMIFRQAFNQTYSLINRNDGSIEYDLGKSDVTIGIMVDVKSTL